MHPKRILISVTVLIQTNTAINGYKITNEIFEQNNMKTLFYISIRLDNAVAYNGKITTVFIEFSKW